MKQPFEIRGDKFVYVRVSGSLDRAVLVAAVSAHLGRPVELQYSHEVEPSERRKARPYREVWYRIIEKVPE